MPDHKQWRLSPGVELVWREWEGEKVAYEKFSGDMHLFDPVSTSVLELLSQQDLEEHVVERKIARQFELDSEVELSLFVKESLNRLFMLRLICSSS